MVNANLMLKWLRDARFAPDPVVGPCSPEGVQFLPVLQGPGSLGCPDKPAADTSRIGIELGSGYWIRITRRYDREALARLIRGQTV